MKIYINGYFLTGNKYSGVYRFAYNIICSLDDLVLNSDKEFILLVPHGDFPVPNLKQIKVVRYGRLINQHLWEQILLPLKVCNNFLINLANFAPLFKRNQLCVIHDALIFRYPEAYSKKFVMLTRLFHKLIFNNAKYIATVSKFSCSELISCILSDKTAEDIVILGNSAEQIRNIEVDNSILLRNNLTQDSYILVVLSQKNSFYKNVDLVLQVSNYSNLPLVCVGAVENFNAAGKHNLKIIGQVTDSELKALYCNAKVLLAPSYYEGFGIPLLEAMENSCPVVASDIQVFHEICGNSAEYIGPHSYDAAVTFLNSLILNQSRLDEMKIQGHGVVCHYRWDIFAKKILETINENTLN